MKNRMVACSQTGYIRLQYLQLILTFNVFCYHVDQLTRRVYSAIISAVSGNVARKCLQRGVTRMAVQVVLVRIRREAA